jgi:hypothetical protein
VDPDPAFFVSGLQDIKSLKNNFLVKILKFLDADPGSGMEKNLDPGSGMEKIRIRNTTFENS